MRTWVAGSVVALALGGGPGCAAASPVERPPEIPPLAEVYIARTPEVVVECPPHSRRVGAECMETRIGPAHDVPAWIPPQGGGDPCGAFFTEKTGLVDCDPKSEDGAKPIR